MGDHGWFNLLTAPSDCDKTPPINGDILVYDDSVYQWKPTLLSSFLVGVYIPYTGALTNIDLNTKNLTNVGTLSAGAITGTSLTDGTATLASGSITGGVNATFSGTGQFASLGINTAAPATVGQLQTTGIVGFGTAPQSTNGVTSSFSYNGVAISRGASFGYTNTKNSFPISSFYGLDFAPTWLPALGATSSKSCGAAIAGYGNVTLQLDPAETQNYTITTGYGYRVNPTLTGSTTGGGIAKFTTFGSFWAIAPSLNANTLITTLYAFYDAGQTSATGTITTAWGLGINTQSYINGNLRIGSAVVPTVALDVTGQITSNNVITGTYFQTSTAPTAVSTGVDTILDRTATPATNAGWLPIKDNTGTIRYVPYWN